MAYSYDAKCQPDRLKVEVEKAVALNPYDADNWGARQILSIFRSVGRRDGVCRKSIKLMGPAAQRSWWWGPAKRHWFRGEYPEAYEAFQAFLYRRLWLSHLDLAYTPPFLRRLDEAKTQVAALLKVYPPTTIRDADAFFTSCVSNLPSGRKWPARYARLGWRSDGSPELQRPLS